MPVAPEWPYLLDGNPATVEQIQEAIMFSGPVDRVFDLVRRHIKACYEPLGITKGKPGHAGNPHFVKDDRATRTIWWYYPDWAFDFALAYAHSSRLPDEVRIAALDRTRLGIWPRTTQDSPRLLLGDRWPTE